MNLQPHQPSQPSPLTSHPLLTPGLLPGPLICCGCLCLFSITINNKSGYSWTAFIFLTIATFIISKSIKNLKSAPSTFGFLKSSKSTILLCFAGAIIGIASGSALRYFQHTSILPSSLTLFAFTAAAIGTAEELMFRGYLFNRLEPLSKPTVLVISVLTHSLYKCALFAGPLLAQQINPASFILWTLCGSLICALLRMIAGHILPSIIAHAGFDVVVYGESLQAPWWVWG